ncbi:MAG: hypothetical protein HFH35_04400 [Eubacterium sp.]|nr:hypothetical protein [Eubacterium sp.]
MKNTVFVCYGESLQRFWRKLQRKRLLIMELLLMLVICLLHAYRAGDYVDFYPINGTFQNFNPVRRLLDGQIPYRDFTDYLGIGHLYFGTIGTVIFGGNYRGSLIAFSFLNFFCMAALSLALGRAVFKELETAAGAANLVLIMLLVQPLFFTNGMGLTEEVLESLNAALHTGNSARFVRGLILPMCIGLFVWMACIYMRNKTRFAGWKFGGLLPSAAAGCLAGFCFIWSNDYGISCFVCIAVMAFWLSLSRKRSLLSALKDTGTEILAAVGSIFIFVELLTLGHFGKWFQTTLGTGGYQSWYYNSQKSYYLFDVDVSYMMLLQAFLAMIYLLLLFKKNGTKDALFRYGIPGFANMAGFCAANEYRILSGGVCREVACSVLFLTVLFEGLRFVGGGFCKNIRLRNGILLLSVVAALAWTVSAAKDAFVFQYATQKEGEQISRMGGNMTRLYQDLQAGSEFLQGKNFFSTYASAQEVLEGTFQTSGWDYVIHVLGDAQREAYLSDFRQGDFPYTVTINKGFTNWEYWCERANWYFYRELYRGWHPVFAHSYAVYWERNNRENAYTHCGPFAVEVRPWKDGAVKLILQTDASMNGTADILLDYSIEKSDSRQARFLLRTDLKVENTGAAFADEEGYEANYLRNESVEYIPMPVTNGYGELTLTASPSQCTMLHIKQVRCDNIYTAADIFQVRDLSDRNWEDGVSVTGNMLLLRFSEGLFQRLAGAQYIETGGQTFTIKEIECDAQWIRVTVDRDAELCAFPAILRIGDGHAG